MATWTEQAPAGEIAARSGEVLRRVDDLTCDLGLDSDSRLAADTLRDLLGSPPDLVVRAVGASVRVVYLATIVDQARVEQAVVGPLGAEDEAVVGQLRSAPTYGAAVSELLKGRALVLRQGVGTSVAAAVEKWPEREPTEPPSEIVSQGPHAGFIEDLGANIALVRHGLRSRRLRWEPLAAGGDSQTSGALLYVDGLIRPGLLDEVRRKLATASPAFLTDAQMLGQWLTPKAYIFPTVGATERQDVALAALLEGRALVMVEGSPVAIFLPQTFADLLHMPSDYYVRAFSATFERVLRLFGLVVALVITPLYVALITVNLELVPTPLFLTVEKARLGVPIPAAFEVLALEVLVEVIRQAGLRMPSSFGQPVSVIGAVVLGQAAVMAGLISAPAVVVVSLAYIVSFVVPSHSAASAVRVLRLPLIGLAAAFGIFGLVWGLFMILMYLAALESFGVPYLAPVSPLRPRGLQDTIWRLGLPQLRRAFVARHAGAGRATR